MNDAKIIDGKALAAQLDERVTVAVAGLNNRYDLRPGIAVVLVGDDAASQVYVRNKGRRAEAAGMVSIIHRLPSDTSEKVLLTLLQTLNGDQAIHGILVQLPLPDHIDDKVVLMAIDPKKDVDGFHPENIGRMALGLSTYLPATPYGIQLLLKYYQIDPSGQRVLVIGRSQIVGSPMSILLSRNQEMGNATVTLAHSRTLDIKGIAQQSDIIIAALGKPGFVTADMVKKGAIVIDVGINRVDGKLVGDVDFKQVEFVASAITPVPGGVGLMTRVGLLMNTLQAAYGH